MVEVGILVDHLCHGDDLVVGVLDGQTQKGVGAVAGDAIHLVVVARVLTRKGKKRRS